jgi:hypothetical protein
MKKTNQTPVTLVRGANVFKKGQWQKTDFYISDSTFAFSTTATIKDTLKADGKYITPGFVEGHTHNLDRMYQKSMVNRYLSEGVTVIRNMTSKSRGVEKFRMYLESVPSPRVLYANWGFTSTLGHPFMAYEPYVLGLRDRSQFDKYSEKLDTSRKDLYNSYAFVDSIPQLKEIWPKFLETDPDLVKIYYFNEDQIQSRQKGAYGLRLEVAKALIDSAHVDKLKVHAHIGTTQEFEKMLNAGIDGFAHTPEFRWDGDSASLEDYYLPDDLLKKAAQKEVILNPTAALNYSKHAGDTSILMRVAQLQTDMIKRYRRFGGRIVPGTDIYGSTSEPIFTYYAKYIELPPRELVSIFTEEPTAAILPNKKIGKIEEAYEATFLIFDQEPFSNNTWEKPEQVYLKGKRVLLDE